MIEPWTTLLSVLLIGLGMLAGLNLLRVFLQDWREGRREDRATSFPGEPQGRAVRSPSARRRMTRGALAACLVPPTMLISMTHAQQPAATGAVTTQPQAPAAEPVAPPETVTSALSVQLNLDYTTAYFYHGIVQEDSGLILQPAARLTVNLYEQDDFKIDAFLATWNSFQGQKTGAQTRGDFTEYWYESDLLGGFVFTWDKFTFTPQYVFLTSPSDAYETVQEFDFTVAYDDTDLLGKFALHPYALLAIETGADAADGPDSDTGIYLELGIAPGLSFDAGKTPITITFPASVGLSLHNYYQDAAGNDDTFGFAQVGVKASIPLPMSERYGKWTLSAGVAGLFLGDNTSEYNGGDDTEVIATIGLQLNF